MQGDVEFSYPCAGAGLHVDTTWVACRFSGHVPRRRASFYSGSPVPQDKLVRNRCTPHNIPLVALAAAASAVLLPRGSGAARCAYGRRGRTCRRDGVGHYGRTCVGLQLRVLLVEGLGPNAMNERQERLVLAARIRDMVATMPEDDPRRPQMAEKYDFLTRLDSAASEVGLRAEPGDPNIESPVNREVLIHSEEWDALLGPSESVFLEHTFLAGLEEAGCVGLAQGWQPRFIVARDKLTGCLLGAVPMYFKDHGNGEFSRVHDLPRLFVGVPFTPHCGSRLLVADCLGPDERHAVSGALLHAVVGLARLANVSVNIGFANCPEETQLFVDTGFLELQSRQVR